MFKRKAKHETRKKWGRSLRTSASIIVLTAFTLGISYLVKGVSTLSFGMVSDQTYKLARPALEKFGIEEQVGEVAGKFSERFGLPSIETAETSETAKKTSNTTKKDTVSTLEVKSAKTEKTTSDAQTNTIKIALMTDSHDYNGLLNQALIESKTMGINTVLYLGDFTDHFRMQRKYWITAGYITTLYRGITI